MKRLLLVVVVYTAALLCAQEFAKPLSAALPTYPEKARTSRIEGVVKLQFVLDESGAVRQAKIISGHPLLREAALENVKTWRFGTHNPKPTNHYESEFVYKLDVQRKEGAPTLTVTLTDFRRVEVRSELYVEPIE